MSLDIYVASSFRNTRQPEVVRRLRENGHQVYDFHDAPGFHWRDLDPNWEQWTAKEMRFILNNDPRVRAAYESDKAALDWCDAVVYVLPCGKSASLELGYAAGVGKRTAVLLDPTAKGEPETMFKLADIISLTIDGVLYWLESGARMNDVCIQFRGHECWVIIDFDGGYEPDTNAHVIEWHFDGLTAEQHDALNMTDEEDQAIYEQLAAREQE